MKINKKSQVTIFIIAGIMIFIAAGILIYLANELKTRKELGFSDPSPITSYANECLKRFAGQGIELSGRQSGYIYNSQGGSTIDPAKKDEGKLYINFSNKPVQYLIKRVETRENYPWIQFPNYLNGQSFKYGIGASTIQTKRQMEKQLEFYIENKMSNECSLSNDFKEYEMNFSKPKATVTLTTNKAIVQLKFPIEITDPSTGHNFKPRFFYLEEPSGIGRLYDAAKVISDQDSQDFLFNASKPQINGLPVTVIKDAYNKDDVIIIQDPESGLKFLMARQNRRPALAYFSCPIPEIGLIRTYDPDEDEVVITQDGNMINASDGQYWDAQKC